MPSRLILGLFLLASLSWGQTFDKPVRKQRVGLRRTPNQLTDRARVTCYFFPNFMVKEVDMGEVDAERLGVLGGNARSQDYRSRHGMPAC